MTSGYTILHLQDKNFVNGVGYSYDGVEHPERFTVFGNDGGTFVSDPTIGTGVILLRCNVTADDLVSLRKNK